MRAALLAQFAKPTGPLGGLAGAVMAARPSNRQRNVWTLDQLALKPDDRVLEIGFGPGWAIAQAMERLARGRIVGVDHSEVMLAQARRRNRAAIADGRVELRLGGVERLDDPPGSFDAIFSANSVQFWPDPEAAFARLKSLLAPGGRIASTYQPRAGRVTAGAAHAMADRIAGWMRAAGFDEPERAELPLGEAPAICLLGRIPEFAGGP